MAKRALRNEKITHISVQFRPTVCLFRFDFPVLAAVIHNLSDAASFHLLPLSLSWLRSCFLFQSLFFLTVLWKTNAFYYLKLCRNTRLTVWSKSNIIIRKIYSWDLSQAIWTYDDTNLIQAIWKIGGINKFGRRENNAVFHRPVIGAEIQFRVTNIHQLTLDIWMF